MGWKLDLRWPEFLIEGKKLYDYMVDNFDTMFDGDLIIKHFNITCNISGLYELNELTLSFQEIQTQLISWIKQEQASGSLFIEENWKPFRDLYTLTDMVMGYKKMFHYENYFFQLALNSCCMELVNCPYNENEDDDYPHFELSFYGSIDKNRRLENYTYTHIVPPDNTMPFHLWRRQ